VTAVFEQRGAMAGGQILKKHVAAPIGPLESLMLQDASERQTERAAPTDDFVEDRIRISLVRVNDRRHGLDML
jgi:hypothetical protein